MLQGAAHYPEWCARRPGRPRWRQDSKTSRRNSRNSSGRARAVGTSALAATSTRRAGSCALGAVYEGVYHLPRGHGKLVPDHLETALPLPRRGDEALSQGLREAAAAGVDDRAPERRPSTDPRADRGVVDDRIEQLAVSWHFSIASNPSHVGGTPIRPSGPALSRRCLTTRTTEACCWSWRPRIPICGYAGLPSRD